jgi:uncharacterized RDD family membrane protein YckC
MLLKTNRLYIYIIPIMPSDFFDDPTPNEEKAIQYAGFSIRLMAAIIDGLVLLPLVIISTYNKLQMKYLPLELGLLVVLLLYKPLLEWKYQATIGKMKMGLKVLAEVGGPMTLVQSFIRSAIFIASYIISALIEIELFQHPDFAQMKTLEDLVNFQEISSYSAAQESLGFIMILAISFVIFDQRHQGVHDKMGRTLVVRG